ADYGINYPSYGLMATDESIEKRADALKRLTATQVRAWTYIFSDPKHIAEAAQAIIANRVNSQLDPEILSAQIAQCKEFFDTPNTAGKPMGWQAPEDWK